MCRTGGGSVDRSRPPGLLCVRRWDSIFPNNLTSAYLMSDDAGQELVRTSRFRR